MVEFSRPKRSVHNSSLANHHSHSTTPSLRFRHQQHRAAAQVPPDCPEACFAVSCSADSECENARCSLHAPSRDAAACIKPERRARSFCAVRLRTRPPRPRHRMGRRDAAPLPALRVHRPRPFYFAAQGLCACREALDLPPPSQ
jgi:hypothetical protein